MKRSTQIGLAAAGVVLVAAVWSSGDDAPNEDLVYNSLSECRDAKQLSVQACETAFADATAKRLNEAPKFQRQADCEAQYGAGSCSSATINGAQYFLPALAGFMLARNLTGIGHRPAAPLLPPTAAACPPSARLPGSGRPDCEQPRSTSSSSSSSRSYGGNFGGSRRYSTTTGSSVSAANSLARSRSVQTTSSRGGFGSIARSFRSSSSS